MNEDVFINPENQKKYLYDRQKKLLDTFLEHHTISKMQYEKSLGDLKLKLNIEDNKAVD